MSVIYEQLVSHVVVCGYELRRPWYARMALLLPCYWYWLLFSVPEIVFSCLISKQGCLTLFHNEESSNITIRPATLQSWSVWLGQDLNLRVDSSQTRSCLFNCIQRTVGADWQIRIVNPSGSSSWASEQFPAFASIFITPRTDSYLDISLERFVGEVACFSPIWEHENSWHIPIRCLLILLLTRYFRHHKMPQKASEANSRINLPVSVTFPAAHWLLSHRINLHSQDGLVWLHQS